jgi:hypothetical protein
MRCNRIRGCPTSIGRRVRACRAENLEIEGPSIQLAGPEASTKANYDGPTEYIPIADAGSVQAQETETT